MNDSVSIVIPAYNEEDIIKTSINVVDLLVSKYINNFEIVVVNDGSKDKTAEVVANIAKKNKRVKLISHTKNEGLGKTFRDGLAAATKMYVTGYPADNDQSPTILTDLIKNRKKADLVSSFVTNAYTRTPVRRFISEFYIFVMNIIFGLNIKYYNGYFICKRELLENTHLISRGFTIFSEIKVRLIKKGVSFTEIPYETRPRTEGVSKALRLRNILQTIVFIPRLFLELRFT
jgi:glycosyltransferase involved in cell wall biosynthesis